MSRKFKEDDIVFFKGASLLVQRGKILYVNPDHPIVTVQWLSDNDFPLGSSQMILDKLYSSYEECYEAIKSQYINDVKQCENNITSIEDLVKTMYKLISEEYLAEKEAIANKAFALINVDLRDNTYRS